MIVPAAHLVFGRKYAAEFDPKSLSLICYIRSWEGISVSGTNVTGLTDLTGNGNNFLSTGSPQIVDSGINGVKSIRFSGSNNIYRQLAMTGITSTSKRSGWIVFKIEDPTGVVYHNILMMGAIDYTNGGEVNEHIYNPNSTSNFIHNFFVDALDSTSVSPQLESKFGIFTKNSGTSKLEVNNVVSSGTGTQTVENMGVYIGQWNARGAKMLFCEFALLDNDTHVLSTTDIANLKKYFKIKYNINPGFVAPVITIVNQGVNGNNTSDVIARLSTINAQLGNLVILMIGTNDWRYPVAGNRRTPAQYQANLVTIVQSLKANGSQVLLMSMPPIINAESDYVCPFYSQASGCDANATGDQFRAKVPLVATSESVMFLDMNQKFIDIGQPTYAIDSYMENALNSSSTDGVHPRPIGALFIAQKINEYLVSNNLHYSKIVCVGDSITYGDGLTGGGTATGQTYPAQLKILLNT